MTVCHGLYLQLQLFTDHFVCEGTHLFFWTLSHLSSCFSAEVIFVTLLFFPCIYLSLASLFFFYLALAVVDYELISDLSFLDKVFTLIGIPGMHQSTDRKQSLNHL